MTDRKIKDPAKRGRISQRMAREAVCAVLLSNGKSKAVQMREFLSKRAPKND